MSAKNPSSIQVCIKVRPCEPELTSLWQVNDGRSIHLADSHAEPYVFDYVFDEGTNNQEVFDRMAKHIVHACMQGFNGTIFAYGQTSSGKTYTMMGDGQNPGVMVLAAKEIFQQISSEKERDFLLRVGYIEIYNEKIYDLLNKKNQDLKIHEAGNGIVNVNCEECIITSEDDLLRLLCMGNKERTVGETNMNERSSRSHAIFRIIIESRKSDRSDDDAVIQSVLNLVDLAGSERADQTGARGARLKEGGHINKSLLFLSNVIKSLSENMDNKFISFRDSKLTRILQGSLCGNALTSIICTIKPSIMEESQSTLSFATRAKKVRIKPQVNEMVSDATMMKRLGREIQVLKDKLAEAERKNESQLKVQDLEQRIQRDMHKIISSTSLSDKCQQKRRRTWCPAPSGQVLESAGFSITDDRLLQFSKVSHLPKPVFFSNSNVGKRLNNIPNTINILGSLDIGTDGHTIDEEFFPAESIDFGSPRPGFDKDMLNNLKLPDLTLTPLTRNVAPLTYEALQEEVTSLTAANEAANLKINELEEQLSSLKETMTRLEVENREAVSLEFEFEAHKKTSKLRVNDLLSALSEKELTIESLQKSLDSLSQNKNSQAETKTRNEREEEEVQSKLKEAHNSKAMVENFKAQNQELKTKLSQLESDFEEIQREYDCLSNQLMESVQENDALREELKQRQTSFDLESMKSSGVGTECSEQDNNPDPDSDLMEQFVKLSESIQQIELQHQSGLSRLFRAIKLEQDENVPGLKLCLESAEYIEGDTRQQDTSDSICLKGFLKRHRFHIMQLSQEQMNVGEEKRLLEIISQLEQEVEEKNVLMEATEATINEMREQMTNLESALLEKSVIVNKVEDYQRQIESLEKQNAEMTMVYEELQDRVTRENSMSDSLLRIPPDEDTLSGLSISSWRKDQESQEVATLKTSLAELRAKVCDMQAEMENQLTQMLLKDRDIAKLQTEFEEMSERCLSMEVRLAELEVDTQEKQDQLGRQAQKLADNLLLIDQLQEKNAQLFEQSLKTEGSLGEGKQDPMTVSPMYDNQIEELRESLKAAKEELIDLQRLKAEEIDALQVEYRLKIETSENETRAKVRTQALEMEENKDRYESSMAALKEQLLQAEEELSSATARCQTELEDIKATLQEKITQAEEERNNLIAQHQAELEKISETLKEKMAEAEAQQLKIEDVYKSQISDVTTTLKEQLGQAEEEREKASLKLEEVRNTLEEMISNNSAMKVTIAELEKTKAEQDLALEKLKIENIELQALYAKSTEQLQTQSLTRDLNSSDSQDNSERLDSLQASLNQKINELQEKCGLYVLDLDKLRQEKAALQSEIQDANTQHSNTLKKLQDLETEMAALGKQKELEKCDLEDKLETFTAKIGALQEGLQEAQLKILGHEDLVSQHESLKNCLSEANELSSNLQGEVERLQLELADSQKGISSRDVEIEQLRSELKQAMDAKVTVSSEQLCLVTQLKEVEEKMSVQAGKFQREVEDLKSSMAELQLKLMSLQEIKDKLETANEDLKVELKNAQNLQTMLEEQQYLCASLKEKVAHLEQSEANLEKQMQAREAELNQRSSELSREVELGRNIISEVTNECEKLRSDLEVKNDNFQKEKKGLELIVSDLQNTVEEKEKLCVSLRESVEKLEQFETDLQKQMQAKEEEFNQRSTELCREVELGRNIISEVTNECEKLRLDLESKTDNFQKENKRLELIISDLQKNKQQLEENMNILSEKCEDSARLKDQLASNIAALASLQEVSNKHQLAIEAANNRSLELEQKAHKLTTECEKLEFELQSKEGSFRKEKELLEGTISNLLEEKRQLEEKMTMLSDNVSKLEELTRECEQLRSTLKSKETSFRSEEERMNSTICSLLEDKRNLEEKLCTLNDIVAKLESELAALQALKVNGSNASFESHTSNGSPVAPTARKSLDRNPGACGSRKSITSETEVRKNRRISVHDERRQSYWNDSRDCGTMTDPVDNKCNCVELNCKLQDCQRDLFIRESQVTALTMELKHHPLKDENAQLKKRVQEEQEKARVEQKRLKMKLHDLNAKVTDLTHAAESSAKSIAGQGAQVTTNLKPPMVPAETQTESELEAVLEKTNMKYQDACRLLRSRYNLIKELEEKLKQNENNDTSNISSLIAGQNSALKAQCESHKRELAVIKNKYESAKRVLMMRKDELDALREKLAKYEEAK
ncbi:kinesin-like protein KIN-7I isoform X2 [Drosophila subpulchrella]|uniref:kinesin-like protein KIN-7I isoform X2 n=1 Tax=Drosophila subpulchrella TaxID=1486046 RepID=UPI0018A19601|nr:kinesin-like protein KIN-7I isoform X2 [Drosophila subpulchrella]